MIKVISTEETYSLRQLVLRPGLGIETCYFNGDERESTFHFGYFESKELVGCVTFMNNTFSAFEQESQLQLRGMAIHENFQRRGIGTSLLSYLFEENILSSSKLLWCNARIKALNFYKKVGFKVHGQEFEVPGVGTHIVMFKKV